MAFCKLGPSYAGMKLFERIDAVTDLQLGKPSPVGYIMGGQDIASTIAVLRKNLSHIDTIMVGGIIGNTILKGNALQMGSSVIDRTKQSEAFQIVERARLEECYVELPIDHVVSDRISANKAKVKSAGREVAEGFMAVDLGNKTLSNYEKLIKKMQAVYMHGPVGASEVADFQAGTIRLLKVLSKHSGRVIIAGEELCLIAVQNKLPFSLMFTDSQTIRQWLTGVELPALATLEQS
ncbi:MAG: phosphoglycerate kinase [Leptonema sp. (in: Bacteria)]|nr:phosphoglycerate kinase [Leptonema sp. (in: bacteria)]